MAFRRQLRLKVSSVIDCAAVARGVAQSSAMSRKRQRTSGRFAVYYKIDWDFLSSLLTVMCPHGGSDPDKRMTMLFCDADCDHDMMDGFSVHKAEIPSVDWAVKR